MIGPTNREGVSAATGSSCYVGAVTRLRKPCCADDFNEPIRSDTKFAFANQVRLIPGVASGAGRLALGIGVNEYFSRLQGITK